MKVSGYSLCSASPCWRGGIWWGNPEALRNYMMELLKEAYPIQDYNRVIESKSSTLYNHYPKPFRQLATLLEQHVDKIIEDKMVEIENELGETKGFIGVEKKEGRD